MALDEDDVKEEGVRVTDSHPFFTDSFSSGLFQAYGIPAAAPIIVTNRIRLPNIFYLACSCGMYVQHVLQVIGTVVRQLVFR